MDLTHYFLIFVICLLVFFIFYTNIQTKILAKETDYLRDRVDSITASNTDLYRQCQDLQADKGKLLGFIVDASNILKEVEKFS